MMRNVANTEALVLLERERANCYRLLSACFYPPGELQGIEDLFSDLAGLMGRLCPGAVGFSAEMRKSFAAWDLPVDYAKLFVGPFELRAPPYGSVYLDGERRVMGDSTLRVINMYREAGLSVDKSFKEMPDHIAAELEFMHYLASKAAEEFEGSAPGGALTSVAKQKKFMDELLGPWIPAFCERIRRGASSTFYKALAGCLEAFVYCDSEHLCSARQGDTGGGSSY
jgi:TorA maturation chaperone TorD